MILSILRFGDMGYFVYFQGYLVVRIINYEDICQFTGDTCLFTSRDMGYFVPPIQASHIAPCLQLA